MSFWLLPIPIVAGAILGALLSGARHRDMWIAVRGTIGIAVVVTLIILFEMARP